MTGIKSAEKFEAIHAIQTVYAANKPLWVYVIEGDNTLWVDVGIDTTPTSAVIRYLAAEAGEAWGRSQLAVITHADVDHFGGLRALKERRPDLVVLAHEADKRWIESPAAVLCERYLMHANDGLSVPFDRQAVLNQRGGGGGKVDIALRGGESLDLGAGGTWEVLHVPGHSPGHLALWNEARRWAIIGDAALEWGVPNDEGRLIAAPPYYVVDAYVNSVRLLRDLGAERTFTSHYGILGRAEALTFYDRSLAAVEALASALAQVLDESPAGLSLSDLSAAAGRAADHWEEALWPGLADPLSAHLQQGLRAMTIECLASNGRRLYRKISGKQAG